MGGVCEGGKWKSQVHRLKVSLREFTERRAVLRDHDYTSRPSTRRVFSEPADAIEIRMGTGVTALCSSARGSSCRQTWAGAPDDSSIACEKQSLRSGIKGKPYSCRFSPTFFLKVLVKCPTAFAAGTIRVWMCTEPPSQRVQATTNTELRPPFRPSHLLALDPSVRHRHRCTMMRRCWITGRQQLNRTTGRLPRMKATVPGSKATRHAVFRSMLWNADCRTLPHLGRC
ncbi:hypothetical protein J3F84DRAFT_295199 [Trichoderma pleuroticola]